jgi:cell division cycle 2-like protein
MVVGREHDKVFMVMEHADHDLKSFVDSHNGPFSQAEVKCLAAQLLAGVQHMHMSWFIHRDIKTSNLLYSNSGKLAICDFGLARRFGDPVTSYTRNVVTLWYRAPELLLGTTGYSTELDMWSVGCVLAEILLKKPLFTGKSEIEQLSEIFKVLGVATEERWPGYIRLPHVKSFVWKTQTRNKIREKFPVVGATTTTPLTAMGLDLLNGLFALDPKQRTSAYDATMHAYFTESPAPLPMHHMPKSRSNLD